MTSIIAHAAQTAHSAAASLLSAAQIAPGADVPTAGLKEDSPERAVELNFSGKALIVGVPGAFTGTCSKQVPGYIEQYEAFKAKGFGDIYVVAVNDQFCVKAWEEKLAPNGTPIRFLADDQGAFTGALGLIFDATPLLGGPRSKRYALVVENGKVSQLFIEENPGELTVTEATKVLAHL